MENTIVRLEELEIYNFKNVKYGHINFNNPRKSYNANLLGLYGQNGSGKTALIDAISLLKLALSGQSVPKKISDYINVDAQEAKMKYAFKITDKDKNIYSVVYEFSLRQDIDESRDNVDNVNQTNEQFKTTIFDEVLSYTCLCEGGKWRKLPVIDTRETESFTPEPKLNMFINGDKEKITDIIVARKLSAATSKGFIFSTELLKIIRENCQDPHHRYMLERLSYYGKYELFIINTSNTALISMNALPLMFRLKEGDKMDLGAVALPLNQASLISNDVYRVAGKVIDDMNIVLKTIVPDLTISIKDLGTQILRDGNEGIRVQLMSHKNSKEIPLEYESEGIKKIISILHLLIVIYNRSSITVAIDELDSGVFEYLLGELLQIISERGKGQLIFTSHNLRPLETLDRGFIAFTSTNPENRYVRIPNVKTNNNLRDVYYRSILLGEQSEELYDLTNNSEIAFAFREAGEVSGS